MEVGASSLISLDSASRSNFGALPGLGGLLESAEPM